VRNFKVSIRLRRPTAQHQRIDAGSRKRRKTLPRIVAHHPAEQRVSVITESTRFALQDMALTTNFLVKRHPAEHTHFEPAVEDSGIG